jgi:hypothetical protein
MEFGHYFAPLVRKFLQLDAVYKRCVGSAFARSTASLAAFRAMDSSLISRKSSATAQNETEQLTCARGVGSVHDSWVRYRPLHLCRPCRRWQRASSPKAVLCRGTLSSSRAVIIPVRRVAQGRGSSPRASPRSIALTFMRARPLRFGAVLRQAAALICLPRRRRSSPPRAAAASELLKLSSHASFDAPEKLVGRRRGTGYTSSVVAADGRLFSGSSLTAFGAAASLIDSFQSIGRANSSRPRSLEAATPQQGGPKQTAPNRRFRRSNHFRPRPPWRPFHRTRRSDQPAEKPLLLLLLLLPAPSISPSIGGLPFVLARSSKRRASGSPIVIVLPHKEGRQDRIASVGPFP